MNDDFARAMRRSLDLTRAGDPAAATRLIREALQPGPAAGSAQAPAALPAPSLAGPRRARRAQTVVEDAEVVASTPPRRSLRDVIAGLARRPQGLQGLQGLQGGGLQGGVLQGGGPRPGPAPEVTPGARFERRRFSGPQGARDYRLYLPASGAEGMAGLIVMLHGCTQSPEDFAAGTAMHAQAERHGLAIVWPEQTRAHNASLCWNWFRAADQGRSGEPAILQGIAAEVAAEFAIPHVFVAGLSAGGAMAAILTRAYPDTFAAVGVHSGLAPGSAQDVVSAFAAMRGDAAPGAVPLGVPAIVFHGTADRTVAPVNADRVTGRLSDRSERSGRSQGRRFTVSAGRNAAGRPVEVWTVEGAGHAWAGGSAAGTYTDPAGPDASAEMVRFFLAQRDAG